MTKTYTEATFNAALTRARAREAADIQAAINGTAPKTVDVREMLDRVAKDRWAKVWA